MILSKNNDIAELENAIALQYIEFKKDALLLHFNNGDFNAWLENTNKHIPDIHELKKESENVFSFSCSLLPDVLSQISLKLSVSNHAKRLNYSLPDEYLKYAVVGDFEFMLSDSNGCLTVHIQNKSEFLWSKKLDLVSLSRFEKFECPTSPVRVGVIGSCFSRSMFRSEEYFNLGYKDFFSVPLTIFHSSLISLMSKKLEDNDYLLVADLLGHEVHRYIKVEFLKNVKELITSAGVEYIVIDNYSDAALEAIRVDACSFLTYNKYFSESIYKRKFSGKEILVPGANKHIEIYRTALRSFFLLLQMLELDKKVVLIGGRLSEFRTQSERWESKIGWIKNTNRNWDIYDAIFLDEFNDAKYIDMRYTNWISDINSPIRGGASPSHYQSEFYKELYKKTLMTIYSQKL
jgi:hypothetical protein